MTSEKPAPLAQPQPDESPPLAERKPYVRPMVTRYGSLREVTLGIQCSGTFPECATSQEPFA